VGEIRASPRRRFITLNPYGSSRVVDLLVGDPLPRIC
jgi:hydrogenase maturation factor